MTSTTAANNDNRTANSDPQSSNTSFLDLKRRIGKAMLVILKWEAEESLPWDESEDKAFQYLAAVDDVLEVLELADVATVIDSAEILLQSAMIKLEKNFRLVLIRNTLPLDGDRLLGSTEQVLPSSSGNDGERLFGERLLGSTEQVLPSSSGDGGERLLGSTEQVLPSSSGNDGERLLGSTEQVLPSSSGNDGERLLGSTEQVLPSSSGDDGAEIIPDDLGSSVVGNPESSGGGGTSLVDNTVVEFIRSNAVLHLREIAKIMIKFGYDKECCQIYTSVRKDVLDESLAKIKVEKVSIEDVQKMDWNHLEDKMKKWSEAVKTFVNVILLKEKNLCRDVFDGSESIQQMCFTEISNGCVMQLLNFADAVAITKKSFEKFNQIFKMYGVLYNVTPQIEELFNDETGKAVLLEASNVLKALGEAAMATLSEFEKQLQVENSSKSKSKTVQGDEIHTWTTYVTNHVKILVDHHSALSQLFEKYGDDLLEKNNQVDGVDIEEMSHIGKRLLLLTSYLEKNLQEKADKYVDRYLGLIFLMNNIRYMFQKIEDSELGKVLGDDWMASRRLVIKQHANSFFRECWSPALSFLTGVERSSGSSTSNKALKVIYKKRFKRFNSCFENIYRTQTGWKIHDLELRTDVRIMISGNVTLAYRSFLDGYLSQLAGSGARRPAKYVKYSAEQIENYLLDLFEGNPRNVTQHRRNS